MKYYTSYTTDTVIYLSNTKLCGFNNPFWGKTHSPEVINKHSDRFKGANNVTAQQYSVTNTLTNITQVFGTLIEAAAFAGVYRAMSTNSLVKGIWRFTKLGNKNIIRSGVSLSITDLTNGSVTIVNSFPAAAKHTGVYKEKVRKAVDNGTIIDGRWVIKRLVD
jgi:hypothetical protein